MKWQDTGCPIHPVKGAKLCLCALIQQSTWHCAYVPFEVNGITHVLEEVCAFKCFTEKG